jgi:nucleoside-diphosphate-sugar epimerase
VNPVFEPSRPGDVRDSLAEISRARQVVGYDPKVTFRDGLEKTFDWFRGQT